MTKTVKAVCVLIGLCCVLNSFMPRFSLQSGASAQASETVKAVWAATVYSLDYPKKATTNSESLKADLNEMVNNVKSLGFNTLFFQVRPAADAFYKSEIFPWSQYLTGELGKAPDGGFDPLEYLITSAHAAGIKVHVWINPYRVTMSASDKAAEAECGIANKFKDIVVRSSDGKLYLNPGEPKSNELIISGIREILKNYAADGIHLDDYFYPSGDFPDAETFTRYGGDYADLGDWRRSNTTALIKGAYEAVKEEKPGAVFSVSPSGIWANKKTNPQGSNTLGAQSYYDNYADSRQWLKEGMADWIMPQIYWNFGNNGADFKEVADWWSAEAEGSSAKLVIGLAAYKAADEKNGTSPWFGESGIDELKRQCAYVSQIKNTSGYAMYRLGSVTKSAALSDYVKKQNALPKSSFSDCVDYAWAAEAIENLYEKGIISGRGDGSFGCGEKVSRADFLLMLSRAANFKATNSGETEFSDVEKSAYYYEAVMAAKELGIAKGTESGSFNPGGSVSREDMAVMVHRTLEALGKELKAAENLNFSDAAEISDYAKEAVGAMVKAGIISGYETGDFKPKNALSRAEAAVILSKIEF